MKQLSIALFSALFFTLAMACEDEAAVTLDDPRDDITISWNVEEYSDKFDYQYYTCSITKDSNSDTRIVMHNFAGLGEHITTYAHLYGDSINIPEQKSDGNPLYGSGRLGPDGNVIDMQYKINFGSVSSSGSEEIPFSATFNQGPIARKKDSLMAALPAH